MNSCYSPPFGVSNGVRQGGVLSPILFTVYFDELLTRLSKLGIGCHCDSIYAGSFGYADDIALLAPSPSAMRRLLKECELFANTTGLTFNASKTQLIYFQTAKSRSFLSRFVFSFFGSHLSFSESVNHLGHILHYTLDDTADINRAMSDLCRKANYLLHVFSLSIVHLLKVRSLPVIACPSMVVYIGKSATNKSKHSKSL